MLRTWEAWDLGPFLSLVLLAILVNVSIFSFNDE